MSQIDKNQLHCEFLTVEIINVIIVPFLAKNIGPGQPIFLSWFVQNILNIFFVLFCGPFENGKPFGIKAKY